MHTKVRMVLGRGARGCIEFVELRMLLLFKEDEETVGIGRGVV